MASDFYTTRAQELFETYRSVPAERVHATWKHLLRRDEPGLACDIGAGSGRDSNWLASLGWDVVAVEPNSALRTLAQADSHSSVQWMDDALPALSHLRKTGHRFDLILVSAVWMHIAPADRKRAFRVLTEMLAPGGVLVVTLRLSDQPDPERDFYPVEPEEVLRLASDRAIAHALDETTPDSLGRAGISWRTLAFRLPDDGTGSLPLLRHVIVNDDKASTYKLGLLRTLVRIADSMPGMVNRWEDDWVEIPFGLVGLFWIKLYHPLILQHDLLQAPTRRDGTRPGYGFATPAFYGLEQYPPATLRVGAIYHDEAARMVTTAIRDACQLIRRMPAHYITLPGSGEQMFESQYRTVRAQGNCRIDKEYLSRFGTFRVPRNLWMTLGQFACWLEPAIVNEWKTLMTGWQVRYEPGVFDQAMRWEVSERDTVAVRSLVSQRLQQGEAVRCVWSASRLREDRYAIDHCLPWAYWPNNDLWNLFPTTATANGRKSDAIPSADLMSDARPRILDWWSEASAGANQERFFLEAEAALPDCDAESGLDGVFESLQHQRLRLLRDQRLREWSGV